MTNKNVAIIPTSELRKISGGITAEEQARKYFEGIVLGAVQKKRNKRIRKDFADKDQKRYYNQNNMTYNYDNIILDASQDGKTGVVRAFLEKKGVNVNCQDKFNGKTPLHFTTESNNIELAKLLMQHGAKLNIKDGTGKAVILNNLNHMYSPEMQATIAGFASIRGATEAQPFVKEEMGNRQYEWNECDNSSTSGDEGALLYPDINTSSSSRLLGKNAEGSSKLCFRSGTCLVGGLIVFIFATALGYSLVSAWQNDNNKTHQYS